MLTNQDIANGFDRVAALLEAQDANPHRVRAYRAGASALAELQEPLVQILERGGHAALVALPHIGHGLAGVIEEWVSSGQLRIEDRLLGEIDPEHMFSTLPGVGAQRARPIHDELDVETLEELELAAYDGRLERLHGFGPARVRAIRQSLDSMLRKSTRRRQRRILRDGQPRRPPVELLLEVDRLYWAGVRAGSLRKIAPGRFNPSRKAWLPIMHETRDGWHFHAMFSNTERAHRLRKTGDWVVIYWEHDGDEGQCTIVTETRGTGAGERVARGYELESLRALGAM